MLFPGCIKRPRAPPSSESRARTGISSLSWYGCSSSSGWSAALPIATVSCTCQLRAAAAIRVSITCGSSGMECEVIRSEEHTSELQSPYDLVCRLLLEKKKEKTTTIEARRYNTQRCH